MVNINFQQLIDDYYETNYKYLTRAKAFYKGELNNIPQLVKIQDWYTFSTHPDIDTNTLKELSENIDYMLVIERYGIYRVPVELQTLYQFLGLVSDVAKQVVIYGIPYDKNRDCAGMVIDMTNADEDIKYFVVLCGLCIELCSIKHNIDLKELEIAQSLLRE